MTERPVPAIKLGGATALGQLGERIMNGVGLEALLTDPIPETIVLPLDWEYSGSGSGYGFTVEFSARGADTTENSCFLHLIVEPHPFPSSTLAMIGFARGLVAVWRRSSPLVRLGTLVLRFDWGQNDWVRWSINIGASGISYRAAKHVSLLDPFGYDANARPLSLRDRYGNEERLLSPPYRVRAIVLASIDSFPLALADVRLWDGKLFDAQEDQLEFLGGRRLDGRESKLLGYWKLAEGEGTHLMDSSRFGNHGTLTGGEWLAASQSGLQLDCIFEVARQRREELRQLWQKIQDLKDEATGLAQQKDLLESNIEHLRNEQAGLDSDMQAIDTDLARELQALEQEFTAWKTSIKDGGKVGLDDFSASVAGEVQKASEALGEAKSPYQLQSVALEVKMLPVQRESEEDFMVTFPQPDQPDDEQVQPGQLSTLSLSLEPRPPSPPRTEKDVPDVRGYTELVARRLLGQAGFRVDVLDQAAEQEAEIDRVVSQEPGPGTRIGLNKTVTVFLGRASGVPAG